MRDFPLRPRCLRDLRSRRMRQEAMEVTLAGIEMPVIELQPLKKAASPIELRLAGRSTLVSPVQPENTTPPMEVTLAGMVTLVSPVQPENA